MGKGVKNDWNIVGLYERREAPTA